MATSDSAQSMIEQLRLSPHPEGGWYRETWRAAADASGRAAGTAIIFALKAGEQSHWHRVDAAELWLWQGGDPLELAVSKGDAGPVETVILGTDIAAGHQLQGIVPEGAWQAARPAPAGDQDRAGYCLVSCVVVPGFDFAGFELAAPGWRPGMSEKP